MSVDELAQVGLERMTDAEIRRFLSNRRTGVLGLPTDREPYLLPLSFGYDEDSRLYFTYVIGGESRKQNLSDEATGASFLVFKVNSMYNWQSVLCRGTLSVVPESEWDDLDDALEDAWSPDLFTAADLTGGVTVYEFQIDEQTGIKHQGLPPGFEPKSD